MKWKKKKREKREHCSTKKKQEEGTTKRREGEREVLAPEGTCHTRHEAMSHAFPAQPESPDDNR